MTEGRAAAEGRGSVRAFVAVEVPAEARAAVADLVASLGPAAGGGAVRWVRPDGLHLTLRFLGQTPLHRLAAVSALLRDVGRRAAPFEVEVAGAGVFPTLRRPRVLWLGVRRGAEVLAALAGALDRGLEPLGWPPEGRPYTAHLTVARAEPGPPAAATAAALVEAAAGWRLAWRVEELVLFESRLARGGAIYVPLDRVPLTGEGPG